MNRSLPILVPAGVVLALALAGCGRPAAEQPAAQIAVEGLSPSAVGPEAPFVPTEAEVAEAAAAAGLPAPNESRLSLSCDDGEQMVLRFFPDQGVAVLARASGNTELQFQRGDTGVAYVAPGLQVRGGRAGWVIEADGQPPRTCTSADAPRPILGDVPDRPGPPPATATSAADPNAAVASPAG